MLGLEIFVEGILSGYLTITNPIYTTKAEQISLTIAYYNMIFAIFLLPCFIIFVTLVNQ